MCKRLTKEEFIERANIVHGGSYDYSLVEYKNTSTKVPIICHEVDCDGNEHGVFYQTPRNHMQGDRCPKCFRSFKKTKEQFVEEARNVHGDKYDYSKVVYAGNKKTVTITCPKHGDFKQTPLYHLQGHGCQCCYDDRRGQMRVLGKENFIDLAREIHGDKYDYSKVKYVNNHTHVIITCPTHGDFLQTPNKHLSHKQGCPRCSESHLERDVALYCDEHGIEYEREKRFPWLKHKAKLPLDFYLPKYNVAIECQGEQHYRLFKAFGGESAMDGVKTRDKIKFELCSLNGVKILYFTNKMTILENNDIYAKENTFKSLDELFSKIV